jgi:hypothetical protein
MALRHLKDDIRELIGDPASSFRRISTYESWAVPAGVLFFTGLISGIFTYRNYRILAGGISESEQVSRYVLGQVFAEKILAFTMPLWFLALWAASTYLIVFLVGFFSNYLPSPARSDFRTLLIANGYLMIPMAVYSLFSFLLRTLLGKNLIFIDTLAAIVTVIWTGWLAVIMLEVNTGLPRSYSALTVIVGGVALTVGTAFLMFIVHIILIYSYAGAHA